MITPRPTPPPRAPVTAARGGPTHTCPGGCGRAGVPFRLLACQPCWYRLPRDIRRALQTVKRHTPQHRDALEVAIGWYDANPLKGAKP
jgi:hypothetical protein